MCGRFTNRFSWKELHERLDLIGAPLNRPANDDPRCVGPISLN